MGKKSQLQCVLTRIRYSPSADHVQIGQSGTQYLCLAQYALDYHGIYKNDIDLQRTFENQSKLP